MNDYDDFKNDRYVDFSRELEHLDKFVKEGAIYQACGVPLEVLFPDKIQRLEVEVDILKKQLEEAKAEAQGYLNGQQQCQHVIDSLWADNAHLRKLLKEFQLALSEEIEK